MTTCYHQSCPAHNHDEMATICTTCAHTIYHAQVCDRMLCHCCCNVWLMFLRIRRCRHTHQVLYSVLIACVAHQLLHSVAQPAAHPQQLTRRWRAIAPSPKNTIPRLAWPPPQQ